MIVLFNLSRKKRLNAIVWVHLQYLVQLIIETNLTIIVKRGTLLVHLTSHIVDVPDVECKPSTTPTPTTSLFIFFFAASSFRPFLLSTLTWINICETPETISNSTCEPKCCHMYHLSWETWWGQDTIQHIQTFKLHFFFTHCATLRLDLKEPSAGPDVKARPDVPFGKTYCKTWCTLRQDLLQDLM